MKKSQRHGKGRRWEMRKGRVIETRSSAPEKVGEAREAQGSHICLRSNFFNQVFTSLSRNSFLARGACSHVTPLRKSIHSSVALTKFRSMCGSSMAELGFVLLATVPLFTLGFEGWKIFTAYNELEMIATTAARYASLQEPPLSAISSKTTTYVKDQLMATNAAGNNTSWLTPYKNDVKVQVNHLGTAGSPNRTELDMDPVNVVSPGDIMEVVTTFNVNKAAGGFKTKFFGSNYFLRRKTTYMHMNNTFNPNDLLEDPGCAETIVCCEGFNCQIICGTSCDGPPV